MSSPERAERGRRPEGFDDFSARAGIDFISVGRRPELMLANNASTRAILANSFDGSVKLPGQVPWSAQQAWMTIHNPTKRDLQTLVDALPNASVVGLEVFVDFLLQGSPDHEANERLYRWLRHSLSPQNHKAAKRLLRKQFNSDIGKYQTLKVYRPRDECTSFLWQSTGGLQTRLYVKATDDAHRIVLPHPVVRLEATLLHGGAQCAGVNRVGLLPDFVPRLRKFMTPMLSIGRGFRWPSTAMRTDRIGDPKRQAEVEAARARSQLHHECLWERHGAAYALRHDMPVDPDRRANRVVENALKNLVERFNGLQLPKKVADYPLWKSEQLALYDLFLQGVPASFRRTMP